MTRERNTEQWASLPISVSLGYRELRRTNNNVIPLQKYPEGEISESGEGMQSLERVRESKGGDYPCWTASQPLVTSALGEPTPFGPRKGTLNHQGYETNGKMRTRVGVLQIVLWIQWGSPVDL